MVSAIWRLSECTNTNVDVLQNVLRLLALLKNTIYDQTFCVILKRVSLSIASQKNGFSEEKKVDWSRHRVNNF